MKEKHGKVMFKKCVLRILRATPLRNMACSPKLSRVSLEGVAGMAFI